MNNYRRAMSLVQLIKRHKSSDVVEVPSKQFAKLKKTQARYAIDDGLPSFLKGGLSDRILYGLTVAGVAVGLGMAGEFLYTLAYPKN